jgi:hypothetical protein
VVMKPPTMPLWFARYLRRIEDLEDQVNDLQMIVNRLQNAPVQQLEIYGPIPQLNPGTWQPTKKCPKCHLSLTNSMSYTCNDPNCPRGMGPVTCSERSVT